MRIAAAAAAVAAAAVAVLALPDAEPASRASTARGHQLRVGLVVVGFAADDPFRRSATAGLRRAVRDLGVKAQVRTPTSREGYAASFTAFAAQRYDLVIGLGPALVAALERVARRFPGVRFATLDAPRAELPQPVPRNVTGIVFRAQQGAYLAGYLAGLVERRKPSRGVVSAVGGYKVSQVDVFIAGYRAGAQKAAPQITVLHAYANSFTAPQQCTAVASRQIARGSGVVFSVAGRCGLGALRLARTRGVWGVGVDFDQSSLGPHILTSALKRFDSAVFGTIRTLRRNRYRSGVDLAFGLGEGAVGLGPISPRVPRSFVARVERIRRQIVSGRIAVPSPLGD